SSINFGSTEATPLATTPAQPPAAAPLIPYQDPESESRDQNDLVSFPHSPQISQLALSEPSASGDRRPVGSPHPHQYPPHSISLPRFGLAGYHYLPSDHYPYTERQKNKRVVMERIAREEGINLWDDDEFPALSS
ncbi:unnamed protein product, partial [Rhizoctonia solani]